MARILVVGEGMDAADGLSTLFRAMGHDTRVAAEGSQAIEAARSLAPDIILVDLEMIRPGDHDIARALRAASEARRPFLIAVTASPVRDLQEAIRAAGFDSFIRRPAHPHTLIAIVTDVASRS